MPNRKKLELQRKTHNMKIRLNDIQYSTIQMLAEEAGMTMTEYIRHEKSKNETNSPIKSLVLESLPVPDLKQKEKYLPADDASMGLFSEAKDMYQTTKTENSATIADELKEKRNEDME